MQVKHYKLSQLVYSTLYRVSRSTKIVTLSKVVEQIELCPSEKPSSYLSLPHLGGYSELTS